MQLTQHTDDEGRLWIEATDPHPHFPFVGLAYLLYWRLDATEVVGRTDLPDERFIIFAVDDDLRVRLSHHRTHGTTLRAEGEVPPERFARFAETVQGLELPTRWTRMHPSVIELGWDLPGIPEQSWAQRWLRALWTWLRVAT